MLSSNYDFEAVNVSIQSVENAPVYGISLHCQHIVIEYIMYTIDNIQKNTRDVKNICMCNFWNDQLNGHSIPLP